MVSQHHPTLANGGTIRLTNWKPRRRPRYQPFNPSSPPPTSSLPRQSGVGRLCNGNRQSQALESKGPATTTVQDAKAPQWAKGHPSSNAHPAGLLRQRQDHPGQRSRTAEGHTARATARVAQTQPHAIATSPLAQPAAHQVGQRRRRFTKRATPSADRANSGLASQGAQSGTTPATGSWARPKGTRYPGGVPLTKPPAGTGNRHPLRHPKAPSRTVDGTKHQARRQGLNAQVPRHQPPPP
ncbi:hypothetical protein WOLCODRAFT_158665 [Wolfiporia cocos MD-104 SS10]|uniref:Uncharacterized protein n=1 Tax=Wolfiporia cocos (strain MD-104) TaxID=742152 RepID=A0A2H3JR38_WOLCO|nr:hypothetical protein WOLCODRAFT_158665 [Wolfiporia cocos MD-104 SS10]